MPSKKEIYNPNIYNFKERNKNFIGYMNLFEKIKEPEPYALLALKYRKKLVTHVGICMDDKKYFELNSTEGPIIKKIKDNQKWIEGYYRYAIC